MKKAILPFIILGSIFSLSFYSLTFHMRSSGSPGGNTGAPGQFSGRTCANSSCHSGSAVFQSGMISSDIPASGYIPGQTYTISGTVAEPGRTKFGFEISPQDSGGNLIGSLALLDATATKFTNQNKSITHTSSGNTGLNEFRTWSFSWTAPSNGPNSVTFWGAFNAANGNNSSSGDIIYRSLLSVDADTGFVSEIQNEFSNQIYIYPNPISDHFYLSLGESIKEKIFLDIISMDGKSWISQKIQKGSKKIKINCSDLPKGNHIIVLKESGGKTLVKKRILKL